MIEIVCHKGANEFASDSLRGVFPILATCFHPDGTIDF